MSKNWWILPASVLAYIFYKKYALSQAISVFFKSVDLSPMSLLNPTFNIIVQINNPTNITATVQNIHGNLYVDGAIVGSVLGITPTTLEVGSSLLNIPITINYSGLPNLIARIRTHSFNMTFKGNIRIDYITLPLEFSYNI
jgi:hypothetical protein